MSENNHLPDTLVTLAEVSERYGFATGYLRELIGRGRLKARKYGNTWLTTWSDVAAYINSRQHRGVYREDVKPEQD